jgi:hypothetical protein
MKKELAVYVVAVSVITRKRRLDKAPFYGNATLTMDLTPELEGVSFMIDTSLKFDGRDYRIVSFREGCVTGEQVVAKFCDKDNGVEFEFYLDIPTSSSSRDSLRDNGAVRDSFINQNGLRALENPRGGSLTTPWQLADANK